MVCQTDVSTTCDSGTALTAIETPIRVGSGGNASPVGSENSIIGFAIASENVRFSQLTCESLWRPIFGESPETSCCNGYAGKENPKANE
jgi:hypothetical protein